MLIARIGLAIAMSGLGITGERMGPISKPFGSTADLVGDIIVYSLVALAVGGLWFFRRWARTMYIVFLVLVIVALLLRPQPIFASTTFLAFVMLQDLLDGAIISMAYLPPLREHFRKEA
jgi:hypothetical protein